jgi:ribonuclease D
MRSRLIRTPDELDTMLAGLRGAAAVALDTEADSLHHYPGKLCLVQVADGDGHGQLVDPLALPSLQPLHPLLADPATLKVLHAADNDLAWLKRGWAFTVTNLFDTAVAARFLGVPELGLDGLLKRYLDVDPVPSRQKDDWSRRPLTPAQETYALHDVVHLIALRERLLGALAALGRERWVAEECEALAAQPMPDKVADPDAWLGLKGARLLEPRAWAVLRELHQAREALAVALDRPPFMIVSNESLVALAARPPRTLEDVAAAPGCSPSVVRRAGAMILAAVQRGLSAPEDALPRPRSSPRPRVPAVVRRRNEALRAWRSRAAPGFGLEPGVLLPQRVIDRLAVEAPADAAALAAVEGVRRWRVELFGDELLKALRV